MPTGDAYEAPEDPAVVRERAADRGIRESLRKLGERLGVDLIAEYERGLHGEALPAPHIAPPLLEHPHDPAVVPLLRPHRKVAGDD